LRAEVARERQLLLGSHNLLEGRAELVLVLLLSGLGTALRIFQLGAQSLWLDELFSVAIARRDWAQVLVGTLQGDTNPPLYNLLLHVALQFGTNEIAARVVSLVFSCATIPLFFVLARDLFGQRAAFLSTLLLVINPFHLLFAQEARMYAQLTFFALAAMFFFQRAWSQGRSSDWALFIIVETLAFYTHSLAFLNLVALDVFALIQFRAGRGRWGTLILSHLAILVLFAPWLGVSVQQAMRVQAGFWGTPPSIFNLIATPYLFLLSNVEPPVLVPIALFAVLALISLMLLALRKVGPERAYSVAFAFCVFVIPLVGLYLASSIRPIYVERTLLPASLGLYLLLAWTVVYAPPRTLNIIFGTVLLLMMLFALPNYYFNPATFKPPMREAAQALMSQFRSGETIWHTSDSSALAFSYYAPDLPNHFLSGDPDYLSETTRGRTGRIAGLVPEDWEKVVDGNRQVYLVVALDHNVDYQRDRVKEFDLMAKRLDTMDVGGILILRYETDKP
jgi:uncharacterized membrane protein